MLPGFDRKAKLASLLPCCPAAKWKSAGQLEQRAELAPPPLTPAKICAATLQLTRVLQDSLGGCARTALIICCSPSPEDAAETLSSLRFGSRARGIVNTVHSNVGGLAATEAEHDLKQQLKVLRGALRQMLTGIIP